MAEERAVTSAGESRDPGAVLARIAAELGRHRSEWGVTGLCFHAAGLEFLVARAHSARWGEIALRTPWERMIENDNDVRHEARVLLEQEAKLLSHARRIGLPAPTVHSLHRSERCDLLVTSFIATDGSLPAARQLGRLAGRLHAGAIPRRWTPAAQCGAALPEVLAERLRRRAAVVRRRSGATIELPSKTRLMRLLEPAQHKRRLLHMDLRPANLLMRGGAVRGLVDWSNALLGDPAFELARIAEYGLLDAEFLAGYGAPNPLAALAAGAELAYRLDAAMMLAVVFLSEAPDPRRAAPQVERVLELTSALRRDGVAPAPA